MLAYRNSIAIKIKPALADSKDWFDYINSLTDYLRKNSSRNYRTVFSDSELLIYDKDYVEKHIHVKVFVFEKL